MALTKSETVDKVEVVTQQDDDGNDVVGVLVRTAVSVLEDGAVISKHFHRHAILAGEDYSEEPQRVRDICDVAFGE